MFIDPLKFQTNFLSIEFNVSSLRVCEWISDNYISNRTELNRINCIEIVCLIRVSGVCVRGALLECGNVGV